MHQESLLLQTNLSLFYHTLKEKILDIYEVQVLLKKSQLGNLEAFNLRAFNYFSGRPQGEANAALEQDLAQCIRGPLKEQSGRIQHLSGTLSTIQTSTLTTYNALTQASSNLSQLNFLLSGLADNPLSSLKRLH